MSDREELKKQQEGALSGVSAVSDAHGAVADAHSRTHSTPFATGAGTDAEFALHVVQRASRFRSAKVTPGANVTGDDTDNVTLTINQRLPDGSDADPLAAFTTTATPAHSLTALKPQALTASGAAEDTILVAGSVITCGATHAGMGAAVPAGTIVSVDVEEI